MMKVQNYFMFQNKNFRTRRIQRSRKTSHEVYKDNEMVAKTKQLQLLPCSSFGIRLSPN